METNDHTRIAEVVAALAFNLGHEWSHTHRTVCETLIDHVQGSFGLYQLVIAWAEEFDKAYEARPDEEKDDFLEAIDTFYAEKFAALKAEAHCVEV
jgi:LmbE family N-acetylglucosaminyl deacetylase